MTDDRVCSRRAERSKAAKCRHRPGKVRCTWQILNSGYSSIGIYGIYGRYDLEVDKCLFVYFALEKSRYIQLEVIRNAHDQPRANWITPDFNIN